jgi:photosystem II stability/assembly factor-like uncharacterized protein
MQFRRAVRIVCVTALLVSGAFAAHLVAMSAAQASSVLGRDGGGPAKFEPAAASFVSPSRGWVLGRFGCAACAAVRLTVDGGRHWRPLPSPEEPLWYYSPAPATSGVSEKGVGDLVFADRRNGYLFGPQLLVTHDGGRSWGRQPLSQVRALEVGGGDAYALTETMGGQARLWRAPIGRGGWTKLAVPRTGDATIAVEGGTVLLLQTGFYGPGPSRAQLGRLWVSSDRGTHWQLRRLPCTARDGGAALVAIVPARQTSWLLDCYANEQSSQAQNTQHHLYRTVDAGSSWARLSDPTRHNAPALLADNGVGHAFLATEGGAGDVLYGTLDRGRHWHPLLHSGGSFFGWADLRFINPMTGFVVGPTHYAPEHLYRTQDSGRTWLVVPVG